ncbi:MAG: 4-diphosphocytidyl-2C-methyl-D-erythritol kinase, partial [Rhizobiaceae bacterium]
MRFGPVPVADAEGAILAHALQLQGRRLKKGRLLSDDDIIAIREAGEEQVIVACLEADDVAEDEAAKRIAMALANDSVRAADAATGRVNFYAIETGCFGVSRPTVDRVNRIDPSVTLATLADGEYVREGRMVATIKIIPFCVKDTTLVDVETLLRNETAFSVSPIHVRKTALIATQLPSLKPGVMDKTARLLRQRLEKWGCSLVMEDRVAHETDALCRAICELAGDVDLLIIFGASAITDIDDVIP